MGDLAPSIPPAPNAPQSDAHRLATRWWRRWTLIYITLLTVGTHWPSLSIGTGVGPPPDKVLHLFAFGGLTLLLWQCRIVKHIWQAGVIVSTWLLFDEFTQSLPILKRESSWLDIIAGLAGVVCAMLLIWSTSPLGSTSARIRRAMFDQLIAQKLSNFRGWLALGSRAFADGVIAAIIALIIVLQMNKDPLITMLIAFCCAFVFGVHDAMHGWWRAQYPNSSRRLFAWIEGLAAGWIWGLAVIFAACVTTIVLIAYDRVPQELPAPLHTVAYLAFLIAITAFFVRGVRHHLAPEWDPGLECLTCGYDLTGHTNEQQSAVCPECGTPFARSTDRSGR